MERCCKDDSIVVGSILPPHFSPFVEEKEGDYVPPERFGQRRTEEDVEEVQTGNEMLEIRFADRRLRSQVHRSISWRTTPIWPTAWDERRSKLKNPKKRQAAKKNE